MIRFFQFLTISIMSVQLCAQEGPNIIYILADDMGTGDVKAYNKDCKFPTPHIDAMAAQGVKFTDAHTSSSVCTPNSLRNCNRKVFMENLFKKRSNSWTHTSFD